MRWVRGMVVAVIVGAILFLGWWVLQRPVSTAFPLPPDFPRPEQCLASGSPERVQQYFDDVVKAQERYAKAQSEAWWIPLGFDPNYGLEPEQRRWRSEFSRYQEVWTDGGAVNSPTVNFRTC